MLCAFLSFLFAIQIHAGSNAAGKKFLEENKLKEGVVTLPSGLQYKVLRNGDGDSHPTVDSSCDCHYHGTLIDGTVFDSSYDRGQPTAFAPNQVIKGWTEAMQLMVEGDQWEMYIPSDLAYGDGGSGAKIKGGDTLIFKMEIIKIKGDKVPAVRCSLDGKGCSDKEKDYIAARTKLAKDVNQKEFDRLTEMKKGKLKPELVQWISRRQNILRKLVDGKAEL